MSSGDWSTVPSGEQHREDGMQPLRKAIQTIIRENDLDKRLLANISQKSKSPPWEEDILTQSRQALLTWMNMDSAAHLLEIAPGQHFLLKMCIQLARHTKDQDVHIWETLENPGVHTGCLPENPILDSGVWPLRDASETLVPSQEEQEPFMLCEGNWQ